MLPNLTFRVVRMLCGKPYQQGVTRFVAIAWNYDHGQLVATKPHWSYTDARNELDVLVSERGCALRWFDGEYELWHDGAQMVKCDDPSVPPEKEDETAHQA